MAFTAEGTIEIDLDQFWEWVREEHCPHGTETRFGVPRVNKSNMTLDIDFAAGTENDPASWAVKPKAVTQWEEPECSATDETQTEPSDIPFSPAEDADPVLIQLRVSQTFFKAVKLLAETEGIARADVIRKAVSLYARARVEQKQGNFIAFARVGNDNTMQIVDLLSEI